MIEVTCISYEWGDYIQLVASDRESEAIQSVHVLETVGALLSRVLAPERVLTPSSELHRDDFCS